MIRIMTFALMAMTAPCGAAMFNVDVVIDSIDQLPGDSVCADASGQCSLRAAINESNALAGHDTINLPAGTFVLNLAGSPEEFGLSGDLDIEDDISIEGVGASSTFIDAGALDRVVDLRPAANRVVSIRGVTLRNGRLQSPFPTFGGGAGLRVGLDVHASLVDVVVSGNHVSTSHAAIGIDNRGCLQGSRVRLIGNTDLASTGSGSSLSGGIATTGEQSCLLLEDSEISDNQGDHSGAIYVTGDASVTLRRSLVTNNVARFAGAIEINSGGDVVLENVTMSGNAGNPGAILNDGGTRLFLFNSTVTANHASNSSATVGGIQDVHAGFGFTFLSNTILAGNGPGTSANDCSNAQSLGGGNIIGSTSGCMYGAMPSDQLNVNPGLGPLVENGGPTRTHLPGPSAIDRGVPGACLSVDQRGVSRPIDGNGDGSAVCDVGAVEFNADSIFLDGFDQDVRASESSLMDQRVLDPP